MSTTSTGVPLPILVASTSLSKHFHAYIQWQDAKEFSSVAYIGLAAHIIEVPLVEANRGNINGRNLIKKFSIGFGIELRVRVHGVRYNAPLIRTLMPVSCV